jgi:hypothetical protein
MLRGPAQAGGVDWSSPFFVNNITSTGAVLDDAWVFELGAFVSGFTPTAGNTSSWATNWRPAQRSFYNITTRGIGGSYDVVSNASPFTQAAFGYIWGHNCSVVNGEWILVSSADWRWPAVGGVDVAKSWSMASATNIIVGQTNGSGFFMKTAAVANAAIPTISPAEWQSLRFSLIDQLNPAISGWNADPDGDGMNNLMEYALGRDPMGATRIWAPALSWHTIGANKYLKLSAPRCGYSQATLSMEVSSNLQSWSAAATEVEVLATNLDTLAARDRTAVSGSSLKRFIRLKVSVP